MKKYLVVGVLASLFSFAGCLQADIGKNYHYDRKAGTEYRSHKSIAVNEINNFAPTAAGIATDNSAATTFQPRRYGFSRREFAVLNDSASAVPDDKFDVNKLSATAAGSIEPTAQFQSKNYSVSRRLFEKH